MSSGLGQDCTVLRSESEEALMWSEACGKGKENRSSRYDNKHGTHSTFHNVHIVLGKLLKSVKIHHTRRLTRTQHCPLVVCCYIAFINYVHLIKYFGLSCLSSVSSLACLPWCMYGLLLSACEKKYYIRRRRWQQWPDIRPKWTSYITHLHVVRTVYRILINLLIFQWHK